MYREFFGMHLRPFEDRADTRFYFPTPSGDEALAMMEYECHYGKGMALLVGETGTGKTLHLRMLLQRLDPTDRVVSLTWPAAAQGDLLNETMNALGVAVSPSDSGARSIARLRNHLLRSREDGCRAILIVDQAENLSAEHLAQLSTLADLEHDGERLIRIILSAQPQFRNALEKPEVARIRQQLFGEKSITRLSAEETGAYIAHRLDVAGVQAESLFTPGTIRRVFENSRGTPRLINHICDAALLAAYGSEQQVIDDEILNDVTVHEAPAQRTVTATDLGVSSTEQVVTGWSSRAPSSINAVPTSRETGRSGESPIPAELAEAALPVQAQSLLARLESAIARAEHLDAVDQSTRTQRPAVEQHLDVAVQDAWLAFRTLSELTERSARETSEMENRLEQAKTAARQRIGEFGQQLSQAQNISHKTQACIDEINQTYTETEHFRTNLSATTRQITQQTDEAQSRTKDLINAMEMSEAAVERLQQLLNHEEAISSRVEQRKTDLRDDMEKILADVRARHRQSVDGLVAENDKAVSQRISSYRNDIEQALDHYEERFRALESLIDASREKTEVMLVTCRNAYDEACQTFDAAAERHRDSVEELERRRKALTDGTNELSSDLAAMQEKVSRLHETIGHAESKVGHLSTQVEESCERLSSAVPAAEQIIESLQDEKAQIAGIQRGVSTSLTEIGAAAERTQALIKQTQVGEVLLERLTAETHNTRHLVSELQSVTSTAKADLETTRGLVAESAKSAAKLESQNATAHDVIVRLKELGEQSRRLIDDLVASGERTANSVAQQHELEAVVRRTEELIDCGKALHDALQGAVAHSDEKVGQLGSHHSAAVHVIGQLSDLTQKAHAINEQMQPSTIEAQATQQQLSASLAEGRDLVENCIETLKSLTQSTEQAEEVTDFAKAASMSTRKALDAITQQVGAARLLKESLANTDELLASANECNSAIESNTRKADEVRQLLGHLTEAAEQSRQVLREQTSDTEHVVSNCDRARSEADMAAGRLAGQLEAARQALDSREPLLTDFVEKAAAVEEKLQALQEAADSLDQHMHSITDRPQQILEESHVQAEQLERVCQAMRKVSAELSQATLEAHQQTQTSRQAGKDGRAQLRTVAIEAQRAIETFREWMNEAGHVQERLERTLAHAPSIRETHPADRFRNLSASRTVNRRSIGPLTSDSLEIMSEPRPSNSLSPERVRKSPTRAQEIAKLLEEAQGAAAASNAE